MLAVSNANPGPSCRETLPIHRGPSANSLNSRVAHTREINDLAGVEGRQICWVAMRSAHWQRWMPVAEDHQV